MVRTLLLPTRLLSTLASCGGGDSKRRRRLAGIKRVEQQAPLERKPGPILTPDTPTAIPQPIIESLTEILEEIDLNRETGDIVVVQVEANVPGGDDVNEEILSLECPPEPLTLSQPETEEIVVRHREKSVSSDLSEFHGWRKSSIDVNTEPPLTLSRSRFSKL